MAEVKWIKLATNIFDNRKIRQIETLPDGNAVIVLWLKLLCLAGSINDSGAVYFTKEIPYTEQMMAAQFNTPLATVQLALRTFEQFGMIEVEDNILHIANWEKYQSVDRLSEIREYNRLAQQKSRAKRKAEALAEPVNDKSMTSQRCHDTDIEEEREGEKERDKIDYKAVVALYNSICVSFPSVKTISVARQKVIKARFKLYSMDDFKLLFEKAEASDFLKGRNSNDWSATFDWLIKDANMAKVLDGNYDNKPKKTGANGIAITQQKSDLEGVF